MKLRPERFVDGKTVVTSTHDYSNFLIEYGDTISLNGVKYKLTSKPAIRDMRIVTAIKIPR